MALRDIDSTHIEFTNAEDVNTTTGWVRTAIGGAAADSFALRTTAAANGSYVLVNAGTANSTGVQYNRTNFIDTLPISGLATAPFEWGWSARVRSVDADGGFAFVGLESHATPNVVLTVAGAMVASIHATGFRFAPSGTSAEVTSVYQIAAGTQLTEVAHPTLVANNEWVTLGMRGYMTFTSTNWTGGYIDHFVNGRRLRRVVPADIGTIAYAAATGGYRHTIAVVNGAAAVADLEVDYVNRWFYRRTS